MDQSGAFQRRDGVWKGRLPEDEPSLGGPPYQVMVSDFLLNVVELDELATRAMLPEGLELSRRPIGLIGFYRAQSGLGVAPYSGSFLAGCIRGS